MEQIAWLLLGTRGGATSLLIAARLLDNPVEHWRSSDRAPLEAAGRSVRSTLDRRLAMDLARQEAHHDVLTGLLNRRALEENLIRRQQGGAPFLLAELDLDGLKAVNDQEGHAQGDKLLQVFARTLKVTLGSAGEVYRLGGDEFVVLSGADEETILDALNTAVLAARQVGALRGASLGTAHSSEATGTALLALADKRMYAVKRRRQGGQQQAELESEFRLAASNHRK